MKVGIVGCGTIGSYIIRKALAEGSFEVAFAWDQEQNRARDLGVSLRNVAFDGPGDANLIVETAEPMALKQIAPVALKSADLLAFSLTAFADREFADLVQSTAAQHGTRVYIPHGAIIGLDGIWDGKEVFKEVVVTTTKPPNSLGRDDAVKTTVYDGSTRGICSLYPRNVNVHAAVAMCGLGFDKTRSVLISDPDSKSMGHIIRATGDGIAFEIRVASTPTGRVTGAYTPESAYQTVKRLCTKRPISIA